MHGEPGRAPAPRRGRVATALLVVVLLAGWSATTLLGHVAAAVPSPGAGLPARTFAAAGPVPGSATVHPALTVSSVPVGTAPRYALYSPSENYVYVSNTESNNLSVISRGSVIASIDLGTSPAGMAYDSASGALYVIEPENGSVAVITGTTVIHTVIDGFGRSPAFVAPLYDPDNGFVYVVGPADSEVAVLNGSHVQAFVPVGNLPIAAVYDPVNGYVYVENFGSNNLSVLHDTSVVSTIDVVYPPMYATVDTSSGSVYVPINGGSPTVQSYVDVINGTSIVASPLVGEGPYSAAYDPTDGQVYVMNMGSGNVSVVNGSTVIGAATVGTEPFNATYDPADGTMYVSNLVSGTVSIVAGTQTVTNVSVGRDPFFGTFDATSATIDIPVNDTGTVAILSTAPPPTQYPVNFTEQGLPAGTNWSVRFDAVSRSSTGPTITFRMANGTGYRFSVGGPANYTASPAYGQLSVAGAAVNVTILFSLSGPTTSPLWFTETGLRAGTNWSVVLVGTGSYSGIQSNSSTNATVRFQVPIGLTAQFFLGNITGYVAQPASGNLTAPADGSLLVVAVTFTPTTQPVYAISFVETGLPSSTGWSVTLNGTFRSAIVGPGGGGPGTSINFTEPNGTYRYSVGVIPGWTTVSYAGAVTVAGSDSRAIVDWQPFTYTVLFVETGLPGGTNWSVTFGGATESSQTSDIIFLVQNGSYAFAVPTISGWDAQPSSGHLRVAGGTLNETIIFTTAPGFLGLAGDLGYYLLAGVVLAVVAAVGIVLGLRASRRRRSA